MAELILVAHGTRSAAGVATIAELSAAVSQRVATVRTAFVDVLGPSPSDVLGSVPGPAVLVPAFLASGYHVRQDIPEHVRISGHSGVRTAAALGPDPVLARVMVQRLRAAGWRRGDAVVLAAAGSSDLHARHQVRAAAELLAKQVGPVRVGYIATGAPRVAGVVAAARAGGARRVFVASYLLAHGLFQQRLHQCGADGVAEPIGARPAVVDLVVHRFASVATEAGWLEAMPHVA